MSQKVKGSSEPHGSNQGGVKKVKGVGFKGNHKIPKASITKTNMHQRSI